MTREPVISSSSTELELFNRLSNTESFVKHSRAIVSIFYLLCKPPCSPGCASRKPNFQIHRSIQVNCYARRLPPTCNSLSTLNDAANSRTVVPCFTKFHRDIYNIYKFLSVSKRYVICLLPFLMVFFILLYLKSK